MSTTRISRLRKKLASILVPVFILAIFALPALLTASWIKGIFFGSGDAREVTPIAAMQVRDLDKDKPLQPFNEPIISVTFDDGWQSVYKNAVPMLQEYGIPTTQYIIAGTLEDQFYLSKEQIKAMQRAGHEVASHTMTHPALTILDDTSLWWELTQSRAILESHFGPVKDMASPLGAADERTIGAIKQNYRSQRNTEGSPKGAYHGVNLGSSFDIYAIKGYSIKSTTTVDDLRQMVDYAVKNNGWIVLAYHQVEEPVKDDESGEHIHAVTPEVLREHLSFLTKQPVRMAPVGQVLDAYNAQKGQ